MNAVLSKNHLVVVRQLYNLWVGCAKIFYQYEYDYFDSVSYRMSLLKFLSDYILLLYVASYSFDLGYIARHYLFCIASIGHRLTTILA